MIAIKIVTITIWVTLVIFGIVYTFKYRKMLAWLKGKHNQKWEELGRPAMLFGNSPESTFGTLSFLRKRDYLSLADEHFNKICSSTWNLFLGYLILFVLGIMMGAVMVISR